MLQGATGASVEFSDDAVADFFDRCVDEGLTPQRFARVWLHTHPGSSPQPSATDEETLARVFGVCDWSVMLILSRTSQTYARLSFSAGPGGSIEIPVAVDWDRWPNELAVTQSQRLAEQVQSWRGEYDTNVHVTTSLLFGTRAGERWGDELDLLSEDVGEAASFREYFEALEELRGEGAS